MNNIGLMMTYNEEDIIEEVMEANKKYFDVILVLDGSTDKTPEIIRSYNNVKYFLNEQDIFPKRKIYDGARQFLLEKAQELYGYEGWFTLLHGDEIMVDNPNDIIQRADQKGVERVNWHALNFFLHRSQKDSYDPNKPIQEQVIYFQPGGIEIRQFKNKKGIYYNLNQMGNVVPHGVKQSTLLDYPIFKHYVHRSLKQVMNRPSTGFAKNKTENIKNQDIDFDKVFLEKLDPKKKQIRIYDGSFHELEPGSRPSFFNQWLAWRHYRPIDWGVLTPIIPKKYRNK
ncbi:MAG: hypothetical protein A2Y40_04250 [Candidatus Margulisbacteria bacterium GWF2_35_9]|nr:MAG: hypothetical protein A2Y40_04250 [Candidatus Margulisbacteria bacterium GWF2_35_9]